MNPTVLWWGRFDPLYARNAFLMRLFGELGWQVVSFRPRWSPLGQWEAALRPLPKPSLVWVPAFRQRDIAAAAAWARTRSVPLIIDPLISAYDKQVFERRKFDPGSARAERLHRWEAQCFSLADAVVVDTPAHADFFHEALAVPREKLHLIWVGADEARFRATPLPPNPEAGPEALFWGSFLPLHGPETIVAAAQCYQGPPLRLTLIGDGPLLARCQALAHDAPLPPKLTLTFAPPISYDALPERIAQAHFVLGIFGATPKAERVIPNKVFQGLASGRPVVTRQAPSYPEPVIQETASGLLWVPAADPNALARCLTELAASAPAHWQRLGEAARTTFLRHFNETTIRRQLAALLARFVEIAPLDPTR